jgi:cysteinyl-tRNA synthetase
LKELFIDDLDALNILAPATITRVPEYFRRIVKSLKSIEDKGLAYEAGGSIYFDLAAFKRKGNAYAR